MASISRIFFSFFSYSPFEDLDDLFEGKPAAAENSSKNTTETVAAVALPVIQSPPVLTGIAALLARGNQGDPKACYELYKVYSGGKKNCPVDLLAARIWLEKAVALGFPKAIREKESFYQMHPSTVSPVPPVPPATAVDPEIPSTYTPVSFETLFMRANEGNVRACFRLSDVYLRGEKGCEVNLQLSRFWLDKAREFSRLSNPYNSHAKTLMIRMPKVSMDTAEIASLHEKAILNDPEACFGLFLKLSNHYDNIALNWLDRAVELKYPPALYRQGLMLQNGYKYKINVELSAARMKEALELGYKPD